MGKRKQVNDLFNKHFAFFLFSALRGMYFNGKGVTMEIKVSQVIDGGDIQNERIVLDVIGDCNLAQYILFQTRTLGDGLFSPALSAPYWFSNKIVKAGDKIVLYTKSGRNGNKAYSETQTAHFFYWGMPNPMWDNPDSCAVIMDIYDYKGEDVNRVQPTLSMVR